MGYLGYLLVFLGAGVGGALRHGVNLGAARLLGSGLPYGTFAVNVIGSFVMGVLTEYWAQKSGLPQPLRLLLTTGILGGFTTFSTFSLDTAMLWERGESVTAFAYAAASVVCSVGALFAGFALVRTLVPAQL
jgi:CrcB protein